MQKSEFERTHCIIKGYEKARLGGNTLHRLDATSGVLPRTGKKRRTQYVPNYCFFPSNNFKIKQNIRKLNIKAV